MINLPNDVLLEIYNKLSIFYIPYLVCKKLHHLANQYNPFIIFKKNLSLISCSAKTTNIIKNQSLYTMGNTNHFPIHCPIDRVLSVHSGNKHTIVWTKDKLYGMGNNYIGQLGIDEINEIDYELIELNIPSHDILSIACGDNFTLILKKNGLYGYGDNRCGQLGNNHLISTLHILKMAAGGSHTILMLKNKVYGFGSNYHSQLGGPYNRGPNDIKLIYEGDVIDVSCGYQCTVIVTLDGVYGLGSNINSELGLGTDNIIEQPRKIPIDNVVAVKNGAHFTLFLTENNELYGCGDNYYGQLGINKHNIVYPIKIDVSPMYFACGEYHMIIKKQYYYGRGKNKEYQFGLGKYKNKKYNTYVKLKID